jgi:alpha-ketoglutarate-dependent taurine dioxygenase
MLKHVRNIGFRIGEFSTPALPPAEIAQVLAILTRYYGQDSAAIVPREYEDTIRDEIRRAAPEIAALARELKATLEKTHSAVLIHQFRLDHLDLAVRRFVLYALTLCMGSPTATDRIENRVIWDIKARDETLQAGHLPTYSEHSAEAELHTDTQYYPCPERYLMLYFVKPAACGGGVSMLRDGSCIKSQMARTEEGRWAVEYLQRQNLPFRIPTTFTETQSPDAVEFTFAPIFGSRPGIRYRVDTLRRGLEAHPQYDTPDLRKALGIFEAEVEKPDLRVDGLCEADDFLIINNHEILHGRGPFTDRSRHALRIRIDDQVTSEARA